MELLAFTYHYLAYEESIVNPDAYTLRRFSHWKLPSSTWIGLVSTVMALTILSNAASAKTAYVATNGYRLNVRSGPGTQHAWVNVLADGQQIDLSDRTENGWAQLTNGSWVASNFVRSSQVAYVATGGYRVNKRSGSSIQDKWVGALNDGAKIELTGRRNNGWVQLTDGSWVAGDLIRYDAQSIAVETASPRPAGTFLQFNSRGDEVVRLQNRLKELGYFAANQSSTGVYGAITEQAVIDFQRKNGLAIDGVAGPETLAVLYSDRAVRADQPASASTLGRGSTGAEVVRLQDRLKALGYFLANQNSTGFYGSITQQAVIDFQQRNGLPVNGIAGPETLAVLYSDRAVRDDQPAPASTLGRGSTGAEVVRLQDRLKALGYFLANQNSTGFYGSITQQAVIDFQQRNGLPANGVAGPETLTILYDDTRAVSAVSLLAPVSVLQFNSSGAEVVRLQNRLKELSYLSADTSTNGYYGLETQQAIIEFQQKNGLMGDGVAGPQTLNILYSNSAVVSDKALTPTVLKLESTGPEVVDLQNRLKVLGYLPAAKASDGYFGLDTQLAVTEFQRKHGLTVDGIAGQATLDLLKSGRAIAAGASITVDGAIAASPSTTVVRVMEVATLGSDLRVREGPSQDTRVLNLLPNGSFIRTTGRTSNGWIQLEDGGWVFGDMVK